MLSHALQYRTVHMSFRLSDETNIDEQIKWSRFSIDLVFDRSGLYDAIRH